MRMKMSMHSVFALSFVLLLALVGASGASEEVRENPPGELEADQQEQAPTRRGVEATASPTRAPAAVDRESEPQILLDSGHFRAGFFPNPPAGCNACVHNSDCIAVCGQEAPCRTDETFSCNLSPTAKFCFC